ncbi:MAG: PilZ domain-containing protein [Nitrospirae bacterium]|nr:PilZ domain-containing protein [Nitrospirota bacterium]
MDDRRRSKRIIVNLRVELIFADKNYVGFIENISEEGIYMVTAPTNPAIDLTAGTALELKFQLPSGRALNLNCKVKWAFKTPTHYLTNSLGLEIIEPTQEYKEFLKVL